MQGVSYRIKESKEAHQAPVVQTIHRLNNWGQKVIVVESITGPTEALLGSNEKMFLNELKWNTCNCKFEQQNLIKMSLTLYNNVPTEVSELFLLPNDQGYVWKTSLRKISFFEAIPTPFSCIQYNNNKG